MRRKKIRGLLGLALLAAILAAAFWYGGAAPGLQGWMAGDGMTAEEPEESTAPEMPAQENVPDGPAPSAGGETGDGETSGENRTEEPTDGVMPDAGKDAGQTGDASPGAAPPGEPNKDGASDAAYTCTLSISCAPLLEHMDWLEPEKAELVPEDGWILEPVTVAFYEGESVFDVLERTCRQQKIHMEFEHTPGYDSVYIEGIQNLYEYDCGERSGWMYKVNDRFPNVSCSRCLLHDGDAVCWVYTCDLGADVGGGYAAGG